MRNSDSALAALVAALALMVGASVGQAASDFDRTEYETSCANCHGLTGKGDGVLRRQLAQTPSDLTTLTKRNGGVFPSQRVWEMIDGRTSVEIGPHGTREMPVWGLVYRAQDTQRQPDWYARNRMASLLDYLARIQEK